MVDGQLRVEMGAGAFPRARKQIAKLGVYPISSFHEKKYVMQQYQEKQEQYRTSREPGDKIQMRYKSIMRTDE